MKHPGHKSAKNQYVGRTNSKFGLEGKKALQAELKRFNEHVKSLLK